MSKKKRDERSVSEPAALKHNPFAALAARVETTSAKEAEKPAALTSTAAPSAPQGTLDESATPRSTAAGTPPAQTQRDERERNARAAPAPAQSKPERTKSAGRLVLRRETKGRGGKAVIIVTGFGALTNFDEAKTSELAQKLKQQLGCGGTVEETRGERQIILQGDRAAKIAELLRALNFRVDGVTS